MLQTPRAMGGSAAVSAAELDYPAQEARSNVAFVQFYERYYPRLLRYAGRVWGERDAEELTQETFVRALESIDLSRPARSQWGWLVVVARNVAADLARSRKMCEVAPPSAEGEAPFESVATLSVEDCVLDSECLAVFGHALIALPAWQSRAWWLTVAGGLSPGAIAEQVGCSPSAVRQALFKSRRRLAESLAAYCGQTRALLLPALALLRQWLRRGPRHVARSGAKTGFAAAATSLSLLGAIATLSIVGSGSAGAAPAPRYVYSAARSSTAHEVDAVHAYSDAVDRTSTSASDSTRRTAQRSQTAPTMRTSVWVARNPLAAGRQMVLDVVVHTRHGDLGTKQDLTRAPGAGLLCGRVSQVHCT